MVETTTTRQKGAWNFLEIIPGYRERITPARRTRIDKIMPYLDEEYCLTEKAKIVAEKITNGSKERIVTGNDVSNDVYLIKSFFKYLKDEIHTQKKGLPEITSVTKGWTWEKLLEVKEEQEKREVVVEEKVLVIKKVTEPKPKQPQLQEEDDIISSIKKAFQNQRKVQCLERELVETKSVNTALQKKNEGLEAINRQQESLTGRLKKQLSEQEAVKKQLTQQKESSEKEIAELLKKIQSLKEELEFYVEENQELEEENSEFKRKIELLKEIFGEKIGEMTPKKETPKKISGTTPNTNFSNFHKCPVTFSDNFRFCDFSPKEQGAIEKAVVLICTQGPQHGSLRSKKIEALPKAPDYLCKILPLTQSRASRGIRVFWNLTSAKNEFGKTLTFFAVERKENLS